MGEVIQHQENSLFALIDKALNKENIDISVIEKMLDMQERIMNKNAEMQFNADFSIMSSDLPAVSRSKKGHNGKYAPIEKINEEIKPVLEKYGFAVSFSIEQNENRVTAKCILRHKGGHKEETSVTVFNDQSGSKNPAQAVGSAITYAKRYALCAMLNISLEDVDDDAQSIQPQPQYKQSQPQRKKPYPNEYQFQNACQAIECGHSSVANIEQQYTLNEHQRQHLQILQNQRQQVQRR